MRWIALCNKPKNQLNINKITKDTYICTKVREMDTKITNGIPPERKTCEWKRIVYLDRVLRENYKHTVVGHDWVRKMAAAALMLTCTLGSWNGNFVFTKDQYYPKWKLCLFLSNSPLVNKVVVCITMVPNGKELTAEQQEIIISLSDNGYSSYKIQDLTNINSRTIQKFLKRVRERGNIDNKRRSEGKKSNSTGFRRVKGNRRQTLKDLTSRFNTNRM